MKDLFFDESSEQQYQPLAARMRPMSLSDYFGQEHLVGEGKPLRKMIESQHGHSFILWGPPGVGKTTFAQLFAKSMSAQFIELSAVMSGVKDIRAAVEKAKQWRTVHNSSTLLFVDEVHRFNKSQQDAFLPFIEDGTFLFVGATTENPAFELNSALLSRARVYRLTNPSVDVIKQVLLTALNDSEKGLGQLNICINDEQLEILARAADGDIRRSLNLLEILSDFIEPDMPVTPEILESVLGSSIRRYDRNGDVFYDQISAFHKSVRGSSPDGALYWMARMLDGGCDPLYIARRLLAIASEDIGNADPRALQIGLNAWDIFERVGPAEGNRAIAQAAVYMASAPKSNAVYQAYKDAMRDVSQQPSYDVPNHLRNAPTSLAKEMGHGEDYRYAHNEDNAFAAGENYLPEEIAEQRYYQPTDRGLEKKISEKLDWLNQLNESSAIKRYRR
ncbi:replication-associated recombination protein A [Marinomonas mediterranea]|jgi:Recombination protein MgsA|uniref:Replication-associated recombination protein A n=1 Tax=Marinomonas mediterranea (strain ATCC 700492 / JCM 21426 / NBRC 103028 / MMB-1) TaxID=717774 RepID=F2JWE9_MARM1|nr:replication-associated recombination protein A [Marinomonas mediterranea]ADZ90622.1 AAA ATPase central domain protein [Marinomonas mediterranea MMB-1]WCN16792.1 AAA family ATPase [Marinomonas mediterranea MMB-1]